ncbi:MAG: T9SS type A sorting domain-containing protein [bacterium]|nr:T9SS type A sorting domain-containing protein [bacterium]
MKNPLFLLLILSMFCNVTSAQYMVKQWDYRYGGSGYEDLRMIQKTTDGGYILGGRSDSPISGNKTQGTQGGTDYWVVKINALGVQQWDKRYGGAGFDDLVALLPTPDGGFLLGGISNSGISGDKTQASRGLYDYWVVKIDSIGNKEWDYRYGGDSVDYLYTMIENYPYGYALGGSSKSLATGDKSQGTRGGLDYWVVYIDYFGTKTADFRFGGDLPDEIRSMKSTEDGGIILGGISHSGINGDKSQASRGSADYWIIKLDAIGTQIWDKRFGGNSYDNLSSISQTKDKGFLMSGGSGSDSIGDKTQSPWGGSNYQDLWIVKSDSIGNKLWDYRFGGTSYDYGSTSVTTIDKGYIFGGSSYSGINGNKTTTVTCTTDGHYWLVKTNVNGIKQWDCSYGGDTRSYLTTLLQTDDGGYLLGGLTQSGIACDKTQASQGFWDNWIVKLRPNWPTTDANLTIVNSGVTGKTISWTKGNGVRRIVVARAGSPITDTPIVGINYRANSTYGLGDSVGNGNFVVYNGTGTSVTVTGLNFNTDYYFRVIAFSPDTLFPIYQRSPFLSGTTTTLPVTWLDLNAKLENENLVQLNWKTASEINNNYFEIERSLGSDKQEEQWKTIGNIKGNGTTDRVSTYQFDDQINKVNTDVLYYRIKQIDFDARSEYSKTVSVKLHSLVQDGITIYPNPFEDKLILSSVNTIHQVKVELTNFMGQNVFEGMYDLNAGQKTEIDFSNIDQKGIYILTVNGIPFKLVKRN